MTTLDRKLRKAETDVRAAHARLRTTREDWPSSQADWLYFSKAVRDLASALDARERLLGEAKA